MANQFTLTIVTDNSAFVGDYGSEDASECARILRMVADRLDQGRRQGKVCDSNGNNVGGFELQRQDD